MQTVETVKGHNDVPHAPSSGDLGQNGSSYTLQYGSDKCNVHGVWALYVAPPNHFVEILTQVALFSPTFKG